MNRNIWKISAAVVVAGILTCIPLAGNKLNLTTEAQAAKVKISKKTLSLTVGQKKTLKIKGTKKKITWKSSNKKIATVNKKGDVTAMTAGKTKITAKVKGGKKYTCSVTVKVKSDSNMAVYDSYQAMITASRYVEDYYTGDDEVISAIMVTFTYTNTSSIPEYFYACFNIRAFQNNVELDEITDISFGTTEERNCIRAVKSGASITCERAYAVNSKSDVEIYIGEPTAEAKTLVKKTLKLN